jgi:Zn-finger nucleic acid-binding protein
MAAFELEGVEIDHCVECHGTWLDAGELEQILALAGITTHEVLRTLERVADGRRSTRHCPRCPRDLREIDLGGARELRLDRCPQCRGVWLDRGEMESLIRSGSSGAPTEDVAAVEVARFFAELYRAELDRAEPREAKPGAERE